jgi:exonuclease III
MISSVTTKKNNRKYQSFFLNIININGLNSLQIYRVSDWICKQDPAFCCMQEMHPSDKGRIKDWKTIFQANCPKKQSGVTILISNKINVQSKVIKKDKKGHFILVKEKLLR